MSYMCCACCAQLDMATFTAACYDDTGAMTMNETDRASMMATISTLQADLAALQAEDVECSKADEGLPCGTANSGKTCQCTGRGGARDLLFGARPRTRCLCAA